jgi:hypothetical protein
MAQVLGAGPTLFLEFVIIAAYCAVADVIYIGRLTAYLAIVRRGDHFDLQDVTISNDEEWDKSTAVNTAHDPAGNASSPCPPI